MAVKVKGHKLYWTSIGVSWAVGILAVFMVYISGLLIADPSARFTYRGEVVGGVWAIKQNIIVPENARQYTEFKENREYWIAPGFTYQDKNGRTYSYNVDDEFREGGTTHEKEYLCRALINGNEPTNVYKYTNWTICFPDNYNTIGHYHGRPSFTYRIRKGSLYDSRRWVWQAKQLTEHGKVYKIAWYRHLGLVIPITIILVIVALIMWLGNCKYFDCWTYCPLAAVCAARKKKDNYKWREAKWVWMPILWRIMGYKPSDIEGYLNACWDNPGTSPFVTTKALNEYIAKKNNAANS